MAAVLKVPRPSASQRIQRDLGVRPDLQAAAAEYQRVQLLMSYGRGSWLTLWLPRMPAK